MRKSWQNASSQKGAFHDLAYAKQCADQNPGYFVFDPDGKAVYPVTQTASVPYAVRVSINDLNIRKGPGTNYAKTHQGRPTQQKPKSVSDKKQSTSKSKDIVDAGITALIQKALDAKKVMEEPDIAERLQASRESEFSRLFIPEEPQENKFISTAAFRATKKKVGKLKGTECLPHRKIPYCAGSTLQRIPWTSHY